MISKSLDWNNLAKVLILDKKKSPFLIQIGNVWPTKYSFCICSAISQFGVTIRACADKGHLCQDWEIAIDLKYWMSCLAKLRFRFEWWNYKDFMETILWIPRCLCAETDVCRKSISCHIILIIITRLLLWDCDARTYSYYVDISTDNQTWSRVADKTKEHCRSAFNGSLYGRGRFW